jgi:hypothetical protein
MQALVTKLGNVTALVTEDLAATRSFAKRVRLPALHDCYS